MPEISKLFELTFESYLQGWALLAALASMGLVVGVLTGLFGVGGGFLITPLLNVAFGIPYGLAVGSSLSFTIGIGASGAARHIRLRNFEPRSVLILGLMSIFGALFGAMLNQLAERGLGETNYTRMMHVLFIGMLLLTAWLVGRRKGSGKRTRSLLQRLRLPPYIDLPASDKQGISLPGLCLVGLMVGVMKGMMGIGGGVLFMPLLILVVGLSPHQAVGTSLGVVVLSSIAGTLKYGWAGNVNLVIVLSLLAFSVLGVQVGAWLCQKLHAQHLRRYFALLVLAVVAALLVDLGIKLFG